MGKTIGLTAFRARQDYLWDGHSINNIMRALKPVLLFTILIVCFCQPAFTQQQKEDFVGRIERLRKENKLTVKAYPDKTFVGSVAGYYDNGSLVLINSLTDAEFGGTETCYYIKGGALHSVFVSTASFHSSDEWAGYFTKHKAVDKCKSCHGKKYCFTLAIIFSSNPLIVAKENGKMKRLNQDEREKAITDVNKNREQLESMLSKL